MVNLAKKSSHKRNLAIAAAALVLVAGISYGGWRAYRKWAPPRLAKRARVLIEQGDLIAASLTIRHAFTINPGDLDTNRLAAEMSEEKGNPEAVVWRKRLADFQPQSLPAALDCAETALRFGKPAVGKEVLEKVSTLGQGDARYHETFGRTLATLGELNRGVEELALAVKIAPQDESYLLTYKAALLDRGWLEDRNEARATLQRLSAVPKLRLRALRALVRDAMTNHELTTAAALARDLAAHPDAQFADRLVLLDLLRSTAAPDFDSTLTSLKAAARGKAPLLAELLNWMNRSDRFAEAVEWMSDFSAEEWGDSRVCAAGALNIFGTGNWASLEAFTKEGDWERLDYVRCALLSRALRARGSLSESQQQWNQAVSAAAGVPHATGELARMIANWGWEIQYADLLRALLKDPKESLWAAKTLLPIVARNKDTTALFEATGRIFEANPDNDAAANNFALYALLLNRDTTRASEIAGKLYQKHAAEADYVSTYAYSLHVRGQSELALETIKLLGPELLQTPNLAAYYGILLAATADWVRAPKYLDLAKRADLLPEEQQLIREARNQVQVARSEPE